MESVEAAKNDHFNDGAALGVGEAAEDGNWLVAGAYVGG